MSVEVRIFKTPVEIIMSASRDQHNHFNLLIQKEERKVDVRVAEDLQKFGIPNRAANWSSLSSVFGNRLKRVAVVLHVWDSLSD